MNHEWNIFMLVGIIKALHRYICAHARAHTHTLKAFALWWMQLARWFVGPWWFVYPVISVFCFPSCCYSAREISSCISSSADVAYLSSKETHRATSPHTRSVCSQWPKSIVRVILWIHRRKINFVIIVPRARSCLGLPAKCALCEVQIVAVKRWKWSTIELSEKLGTEEDSALLNESPITHRLSRQDT